MMKTLPARSDKQNATAFRVDSVDSRKAEAVSFLIQSR